MDIKKIIGRKVRLLRDNMDLSQKQFAKLVKRSPSTVSGWETGDIRMSIESLISVARLTKADLNWLLDCEGSDYVKLEEGLTPEESRILNAFQHAKGIDQQALLRLAESIKS